jgi:low temperature requirement protein LtrA
VSLFHVLLLHENWVDPTGGDQRWPKRENMGMGQKLLCIYIYTHNNIIYIYIIIIISSNNDDNNNSNNNNDNNKLLYIYITLCITLYYHMTGE